MATLPDIDTSQVSFIAYWNILESASAGHDTFDPLDIISWGGVESTTTYDNGVAGDFSLSNGRTGHFRAKTDGWIITYLDRTEQLSNDTSSNRYGPWDIGRTLGRGGNWGTPTLNEDELERALHNFYDETPESGDTNSSWDGSEVGYYNYWHPGTNVTLLGDYVSGYGGQSSNNTLEFTASTTVGYHAIYAAGQGTERNYGNAEDWRIAGSRVVVGGTNSPATTILATKHDENLTKWDVDEERYAARRAENINFAQSTETAFDSMVQVRDWNDGSGEQQGECQVEHIIVWS